MKRRFALLTLPVILLAMAAATPASKRPPSAPVPLPDLVRVAITTEQGIITLELDNLHAPIATRNFVRYADQRRFDGVVFYRVMKLSWGTQPNGLNQGGVQGNPLKTLPPVAHETTEMTGIKHTAGAISMARNAPGTARGDFSILLSDLQGLDADPKATDPELQAGFTAFGHVIEGMDVVRKVYEVPLSPTLGQGVMKGQMIARPVKILTVRRIMQPTALPTPAPAQP